MKKTLLLILILTALVASMFSLTACSASTAAEPQKTEAETAAPSEETAPADDKADAAQETASSSESKTIAFMVKHLNSSFWVEMADAAQKQCDEYGWTLQVLAPVDSDSNEQQIQLIEQSLVNPPDLYIICPTDSKGIVPAIEEINEAGIPIINLNTQIIGDVELVTFLSCENYNLGYKVAKAGAELVGNQGNVVMLSGVPGSQNSIDRIEGARAAYTEAGMEIIDEQIGNNERSVAYTKTQTLLQKYDNINVIYTANGEMGVGASVAVAEAGLEGSVFVQTVDCYDEVVSAVKDGKIQICIDNAGDIQGRDAIKLAKSYFDGEEIPAATVIDSEVVTIDNLEPYLEKYNLK